MRRLKTVLHATRGSGVCGAGMGRVVGRSGGVLGSQGNNAIARALVGSIPAARALFSPWAYPW